MAVKTIVIGMGSFGHDVCDSLLRRIESEFGSSDKVTWIKFLIYETEQNTKSFAANKDLVHHMGIDRDKFGSYLANPAQTGAKIKFNEWADDGVRNLIQIGGVPTNGANNSRPTGRLCFLDDTNTEKFESQFRKVYNELLSLSPVEALKALGNPQANPGFRFAGTAAGDTITVFVIGSLSGGTNSGCFTDVGYFLKSIDGIGNRIALNGVALIPNQAYANSIHWGNTFGALTEINHFVSGKPYKAKFATRTSDTTNETLPYDNVIVLQSQDGGDNPNLSIGPIQESMSELLHLHAIDDPQSKIVNQTVNVGMWRSERDMDGRPMNYCSLGASVILFPVDYIINGLTAQLATQAIEPLLEVRTARESDVDGWLRQLYVDQRSYNERFRSHEKIQNYLIEIGNQTEQAAKAALKGDVSALDNINVRIQKGVATANQGFQQNFKGEFQAPIEEISNELALERETKFDELVLQHLRNPSFGTYWTESLLKKLAVKITARLEQLKSPNTDIDVYAEAKQSKERAERIKTEQFSGRQRKGCNPFARFSKKTVETEFITNYQGTMRHYWESSILIKSDEFERDVLDILSRRVATLLERLNHPTNGLIQFLSETRDKLKETYVRTDTQLPIVNGLCLYKPGETLAKEWARCLPEAKKVEEVKKLILDGIDREAKWFRDVIAPNNISPYDQKRESEWNDIEKIQKLGLEFFKSVKEITVEQMLVTWPNWQQEIKAVAEKGRAFVDLDTSRNQFLIPSAPDGFRRPGYVYFHGAQNAAGDKGRVANAISQNTGMTPELWEDKHRILFAEGLTAFSLYSIRGVQNAEGWYGLEKQTRSDIVWTKLSGKPLDNQQRYYIGLILVAASLGIVKRNPDGSLCFVTTPSPLHQSRNFVLGTTTDLADCSYMLGKDKTVAQDLTEQVKRKGSEIGLKQWASTIDTFNGTVPNWMLTFNRKAIDKEQAFLRELDFLMSIDGLTHAIVDLFPSFNPNAGNWVVEDVKGIPSSSAYRCNRCRQFLAPTNVSVPEGLPEVCTNSDCQQQIRFDLIFGLDGGNFSGTTNGPSGGSTN